MAVVSEQGFNYLKAPIKRITLPDCPAPASQVLEKAYYPSAENIMDEIKKAIGAV
jgi:pyruvate dehydrogenase E1 component beta subunit